MSNNEYSRPSSGNAGCNYASLCNYYSQGDIVQNTRNARPTVGLQVVPQFNAIGYNALTHGQKGGCGSYFNIISAYGENADTCDQLYMSRMCNGCNQ